MINKKKQENAVSNAINTLSKAIKNDDGYAIGWQANIAMLLYDFAMAQHPKAQIHKKANEMAGQFIKIVFGRNTESLI